MSEGLYKIFSGNLERRLHATTAHKAALKVFTNLQHDPRDVSLGLLTCVQELNADNTEIGEPYLISTASLCERTGLNFCRAKKRKKKK